MSKPKAGIFGITGCMGCQLSILFQHELLEILDKIELVACPGIKGKNETNNFDIIFLEGTVVNKEDLRFVKELRGKTKILVAIGSCATDGCIPQIKNFASKNEVEKYVYGSKTRHLKSVEPSPLDKHVKVDYYLRGCPLDKVEFLTFLKDVLLKKEFKPYEKPICHECNLQENDCLLEKGQFCMGPVTIGECSIMCPHHGFRCIGCRGPYTDSNFDKYFILLEENKISVEETKKLINKFAGLKIKETIEEGIKQKTTDKRFSMK